MNYLAIELLPTPLEPTIMILKTRKFSGPLYAPPGACSLDKPTPGASSLDKPTPEASSLDKPSPGGSSLEELEEPSASVVSNIGLIYLLIWIYSTFLLIAVMISRRYFTHIVISTIANINTATATITSVVVVVEVIFCIIIYNYVEYFFVR